MTFGGEPLLCVPTVCAVHQRAEALGIPRRQLITSGCFTHDKALREHTADRLEASGVNEILLSVDAFHTEHLPLAEQYAFLDHTLELFSPRYGCGKCQTAVPCESCRPGLQMENGK